MSEWCVSNKQVEGQENDASGSWWCAPGRPQSPFANPLHNSRRAPDFHRPLPSYYMHELIGHTCLMPGPFPSTHLSPGPGSCLFPKPRSHCSHSRLSHTVAISPLAHAILSSGSTPPSRLRTEHQVCAPTGQPRGNGLLVHHGSPTAQMQTTRPTDLTTHPDPTVLSGLHQQLGLCGKPARD